MMYLSRIVYAGFDDTSCHGNEENERLLQKGETQMRADRLVAMLLLLQNRKRWTARALATNLEVSQRTILRDVEALSIAGIPITAQGGRGGGIALDANYRITLTGLKAAELQSLMLTGNIPLLKEVGLDKAAESALLKVSATIPAQYQSALEFMRQRIFIDPLWWWRDADSSPFLAELQQAVYESHCIRATYERRDGTVAEHILEPYSLVAKSGTWYLIARREGALRVYHLSRFQRVALLDTSFCREDDFDLPTYWEQRLRAFAETAGEYTFTLRIHESRLPFVRRLAPGRSMTHEPSAAEGWALAHFQVESMDLAKMLVFGLGSHACVVEPAELQAAVVQAARDLLHLKQELA
jgi:predicted DNA-binding transcriptional regulator YafY